MKKISSFGERMKEARMSLPAEPSLEEIGREIGVSKQALSRYELNERQPKQPVIEALARYFNVSPLWLMGYAVEKQNEVKQPKMVPLLGTIAAGAPMMVCENIERYVYDYSGKANFALKVKGDSMINARIFNGDTVLIRKQDDVESGDIAAVLYNGDEVTLKRVIKKENCIILHSENPTMPDRVITPGDYTELKILGKTIQVIFDI